MRRIKEVLFFVSMAALLMACDKNRVFEKYETIKDARWASESPVKFNVSIEDTTAPHTFYIDIRHDETYRYKNLYLFVKTIFPNGKHSRDTLECILADEKDKWLGDASFNLYDNKIPFKRNVRFPLKGNYTFEIQQGMREDTLSYIVDVGMRIEKSAIKQQ